MGDLMAKKSQHVVPQSGKWAVRSAGAARASSVHSTQADAINAAKKIASNNGSELYIHGKDGRIRERNSYGADSHPPKG